MTGPTARCNARSTRCCCTACARRWCCATPTIPRKRAPRSNPENAPHLTFIDFGGYGYTTVRASPEELETEFVCIPPPLERSETEDGGPLRYRVIHRVPRWAPGERPQMQPEVIEGDVETSI